jgi:hypothetical protein
LSLVGVGEAVAVATAVGVPVGGTVAVALLVGGTAVAVAVAGGEVGVGRPPSPSSPQPASVPDTATRPHRHNRVPSPALLVFFTSHPSPVPRA